MLTHCTGPRTAAPAVLVQFQGDWKPALLKPSLSSHTQFFTRLLLHPFCMTLLSERGESNKIDANKVSQKASYKAPLTRKTRLELLWLSATSISSINLVLD